VFCLGQHVLIDTGQCIAKAAGQPQPVPPPAPPSATQTTPTPGPAGN